MFSCALRLQVSGTLDLQQAWSSKFENVNVILQIQSPILFEKEFGSFFVSRRIQIRLYNSIGHYLILAGSLFFSNKRWSNPYTFDSRFQWGVDTQVSSSPRNSQSMVLYTYIYLLNYLNAIFVGGVHKRGGVGWLAMKIHTTKVQIQKRLGLRFRSQVKSKRRAFAFLQWTRRLFVPRNKSMEPKDIGFYGIYIWDFSWCEVVWMWFVWVEFIDAMGRWYESPSDNLRLADQLWINGRFGHNVFNNCRSLLIHTPFLVVSCPLLQYVTPTQHDWFKEFHSIFTVFVQMVASAFVQKTPGSTFGLNFHTPQRVLPSQHVGFPGVIWWWVNFMSCVSWEWWMSTWRVHTPWN